MVHGLHVEKKIINGKPNCLNYCEIFVVDTEFTNVAAGHKIQSGGPWVCARWKLYHFV
jgi:hypothetical protein